MYKKFLTGSRVFFNEFKDFNSHDTDYILLFKTKEDIFTVAKSAHIDYFYKTEEKFLESLHNDLKNHKHNAMSICSILTPNIQSYFNFTLDDIKFIEDFIPQLDNKHKYLEIIYNSYKENNKFELTPKLLNNAYESYKKSRLK